MPKRVALGAAETFDPTPEEVQKAERSNPTRRPMCIKCKSSHRMNVWETVSHRIQDGFKAISKLLLSARGGTLSRDEVERVRRCHELLCRASKARYCQPCVVNTVAYVLESVETVQKMRA